MVLFLVRLTRIRCLCMTVEIAAGAQPTIYTGIQLPEKIAHHRGIN